MSTRAEVLATAESLINGDRADTYGPPEESFGRIGRIWGAILNLPDIDPSTVALMMAGMKISRASGQLDHEDSYVDLAGYAALGAEMGTREKPPMKVTYFGLDQNNRQVVRHPDGTVSYGWAHE